jgi:hypothetical protein
MGNQIKHLPLRIYLDTSDYSRFADIGYRNEPGLADILTFLREKKEQGLIEFRFSGVHIFEFLKDPSQRELALRKVQIMEELCGGRAFRFFSDVLDLEREALRSKADPTPLVMSGEGEWFPPVEPDNSFSRDALIRRLQESFPALPAAHLRELIKNPEAAAFVKEGMSKEFPLANFYGSNLLDRFLSDGISGNQLARELVKEFARPSIFIKHYLEGNPKAQKVFSVLPHFEQTLHGKLVQAQESIKPHVKSLLGLEQEAVKAVRKYVKKLSLVDSSTSYLGVDELPTPLQQALEQNRFVEELPALSIHFNLLTAYLRDLIYPSPVLPEVKESDAGDILHATYLPYVDLYRTDGRFGALLNNVAKPSTVMVVPKLRQLPEAIEEKLVERSKSSAG